jgi:YCII-related domain
VGVQRLHSPESATSVRVRNGEPEITDGPFAVTKEVLAGYYVLECADLDEALKQAARVPAAVHWSPPRSRPYGSRGQIGSTFGSYAARCRRSLSGSYLRRRRRGPDWSTEASSAPTCGSRSALGRRRGRTMGGHRRRVIRGCGSGHLRAAHLPMNISPLRREPRVLIHALASVGNAVGGGTRCEAGRQALLKGLPNGRFREAGQTLGCPRP